MPEGDTIFALSSGSPPAAIAVVRISGPSAVSTLEALAGSLPAQRRVSLRTLSGRDGAPLDRALVHWSAGPATATGEDIAELHLHGGRAVVTVVLRELGIMSGLRMATPGEFTRRAFLNGRIDLAEAEGLADLLAAETETQRRQALAQAGGAFSRLVEGWRRDLLSLSATLEAHIEYGEEDDLGPAPLLSAKFVALANAMRAALASPPAERLRDGVRVVIAGPPNAGKSTLLNALAGRDAAIISELPGTTRDVIEAPVIIDGIPFVLADTAGLRDTCDAIESEGVSRARGLMREADIVLWLGPPGEAPAHRSAIKIHAKADASAPPSGAIDLSISAMRGDGMAALRTEVVTLASGLIPRESEIAMNARQRQAVAGAAEQVGDAADANDVIIVAEHIRAALAAIDTATGRATTEDMLDALFGNFCIGK